MKLAFYSGIVNNTKTGPGVYLVNLLQEMVKLRSDSSYFSFAPSIRHKKLHQQSVRLLDPTGHIEARTFPMPYKAWYLSQTYLHTPSMQFLLGSSFDVFHQMWPSTLVTVPNAKLVVSLHDTVGLVWSEEEKIFPYMAQLLHKAAIVLTVSEFSKQAISKAFNVNIESIHTIYNGCDHNRYHTKYTQAEVAENLAKLKINRPYFLYVGGQTPRKNLPRLIKAFAEAKRAEKFPHNLVLVGPLSLLRPEVQQAITESGCPEAIQVAGYVEDGMMPYLYRGAEALLFPSLHEGFGLPVVEAMACGTLVLTSNTTSLPEVAGEAAILVNPEEIEEIAQGIIQILREKQIDRIKRVEQGIIQAQKFSWRHCAEQHLEIYDQIIARSKS